MAELLRSFMREAVQQIYVVTAKSAVGYAAFTASAMSADLKPPLMLLTVIKGSRSYRPLIEAEHFVLHLLEEKDVDIAKIMGDHVEPARKLEMVGYEEGPYGPVIRGIKNYLVLRKWRVLDLGENALVIGEVVGGRVEGAECPLTYRRREYRKTCERGER